MPIMTIDELQVFLEREFPQLRPLDLRIEALADRYIRLRVPFAERHLRPGGTLSGPTMMALADCGTYLALLAMIGPVKLAVTTSLNINFLQPAPARDLIAETRLLRLGRRLAVGEVRIHSDGAEEPAAQATVTYAIPNSAPAG